MANSPQLIERTEPEHAIRDALTGAAGGEGAAVFLTGTAGIGKTAMLRWAAEFAAAEGCLVAHAVASRMERGLPFGLLGQAIVALGGNPIEDVASLAGAGGQSARFYRTLRWFAELAEQAPVVVALDDLQWADPDSLELLGFLCRRLAGVRAAVIGTLRPEPPLAQALVHELASSGFAHVTAIEPLSRDGAAELLSQALGRPAAREEAGELWRACAGTPLLLKAAGRALAEGVPLRQLEDGPMSDSALLLRRFADVGGRGFDYVKAGAILGVHFDHETATRLAGVPPSTADDALSALVRSGVLEDLESGSVAFVHPLFVQALLDGQPSALRRRQHAAAFEILVEQRGPDALAAEHARLAGLLGDPVAIEVTARAGRTALAQGALRAASTHFENALWLAGAQAPPELALLRGQALVAQAEVEQARTVCGELAARDLDPGMRSQVLRLLARIELLASRPEVAQRLFVEAAAVAPDDRARIEVLCDALLSCLGISPAQWVKETADRALALTPEGTPPQRLLRFIEGYVTLISGCDPTQAAPVAEEVIRVGARAMWPGQGWNLTLAVFAVIICKELENFDGARAIFELEYQEAVRAGAPVLMSGLAVAYADVLLRLGRPAQALELVDQTSSVIDQRVQPWTDLAAAVLCSELGHDVRAREHIDALREFSAGVPPEQYAIVSLWLHLLDARAQLAAGLPAEASDTMVRAAQIATLAGRCEPCLVPWAGVAVDAHLAAGRAERARALLVELESRSRALPSRWPAAVIALGRAGLAAQEGAVERADELYAQAIELLAQLRQPIELAAGLVSLGSHLRRTSRPREARDPLARAVALCEAAGAERLARVARAELSAAGGRRRRRDGDRSELTAQELRVAALAAEGMANGQIGAALHLSPKTVSFHLQRIYSKLDIHSRRELIRRAAEFRDQS